MGRRLPHLADPWPQRVSPKVPTWYVPGSCTRYTESSLAEWAHRLSPSGVLGGLQGAGNISIYIFCKK